MVSMKNAFESTEKLLTVIGEIQERKLIWLSRSGREHCESGGRSRFCSQKGRQSMGLRVEGRGMGKVAQGDIGL